MPPFPAHQRGHRPCRCRRSGRAVRARRTSGATASGPAFDDAVGAGWRLVTHGPAASTPTWPSGSPSIGGAGRAVGRRAGPMARRRRRLWQVVRRHGVVAALQRPDFALFGTATEPRTSTRSCAPSGSAPRAVTHARSPRRNIDFRDRLALGVMARQRQGRSLVEDVYEALRADILFGRRLPGVAHPAQRDSPRSTASASASCGKRSPDWPVRGPRRRHTTARLPRPVPLPRAISAT